MEQIPLLREIAIVAAAAVMVALVVGRLRLPTVAGLLLAGALVGPHAFNIVSDTHAIEVIAEVGVVLLLFTIGLEFSLGRLQHIFRQVALGGLLQVGGTLGLVAVIAVAFGAEPEAAIFYGFVFALSSTAIVLRGLTERRELDAPHGRFIVGALIFQDLCVIPMVLLVPLLGNGTGGEGTSAAAIVWALTKAVAVVVGVLGLSRFIVPHVLSLVDANRSREVFLLAVVCICIGTAWLTSLAGLSLALGAFLGGMVVADTEYSHRAMGDILPLRDVFVSFFFVSLGMFFDVRVLIEQPLLVGVLLVGFIGGKGLIATLAALVMRFPPRAAWLAGVGLAQFGEFGFVLVRLGTSSGVVEPEAVSPVLNAGIISMFLTPVLLQYAPHLTAGERLLAPLAKLLRARSIVDLDVAEPQLCDHVIVVGYGVAGRLMVRALRNVGVPHLVLELSAEAVRTGRRSGDRVFYADATSEEALGHARVERARYVVVLINDPNAAMRVVDTISRVAPDLQVLTRTHYLAEQERLLALGANSVVAEEVEGGIEALARVLRALEVPRNVIDAEIRDARARTQTSVREVPLPRNRWNGASALSEIKVESVEIVAASAATGRSPRELDLRARTGAYLVAIRAGEEVQTHPDPDEPLRAGDVAYLIGEGPGLKVAVALLGSSSAENASSTARGEDPS